jgi:hypothetical protein
MGEKRFGSDYYLFLSLVLLAASLPRLGRGEIFMGIQKNGRDEIISPLTVYYNEPKNALCGQIVVVFI